jgi:predicted DNA-binding transcriptional regulator YafY
MKMLILLKHYGQMKVKDIASELEVNDRMVHTYKDDLMKAGIYLESKPGRYGGYSLPKTYDNLLHLNLSPDEVMSLEIACKHLEESGFVYTKELKEANQKIIASIQINKQYQGSLIPEYQFGSKSSPAARVNNIEREYCKTIHAALIQNKNIVIKYYSLNQDTVQKRTISPYALYEYKNAIYMTGFCHLRTSIRDFKLSRIKSLVLTDDYFDMPKDFDLKSYMNTSFGIMKDNTRKVILKIRHPMSQIIKEKIWSENQVIKEISEDKSIIFEAKLQGEVEIISWILSMGTDVEVIEPIELKNTIKEILEKMISNF